MNISENGLNGLRARINTIKEDNKINEVLKAGNLLPLLKLIAPMDKEQPVLYAFAIAECIQ